MKPRTIEHLQLIARNWLRKGQHMQAMRSLPTQAKGRAYQECGEDLLRQIYFCRLVDKDSEDNTDDSICGGTVQDQEL